MQTGLDTLSELKYVILFYIVYGVVVSSTNPELS